MAGERGFHRDFCRFKVADFADQNNVGVLAQESAQSGREVQPDLLLHLYLIDTRQLEFDGIFCRHDVGLMRVQPRDRRIQRVGFSRSGRSSDQHHAVRFQNLALEFSQRFLLEAQLGHVQAQVFFVQQTHDDFFAEERRDGRNTEVEFFLLAVFQILDHDATVLRQALLADVQFGHDLDAAGDRVLQFHRRRHHVLQNAVNAEPRAKFFFVRLDVNVARTPLHRVGQNQVHQLNDRRFFGRLLQRGQIHFRFVRGNFQGGFIAGQVLHHLVEFADALYIAVEFVDRFADGRFRRHHRLHVEAGHELDVVHGEDVRRIGHRDGQSRTHARERDDLVADRGLLRDQLDDRRVHFVEFQVDRGHAVLPGKHRGDVIVVHEAQFHQAGAQAAATLLLVLEGLLKLIRSDQAVFDQNFAES